MGESYTDLLVNAFNQHTSFQKNLIVNLGLTTYEGWEGFARKAFSVKKKGKQKAVKMCPDMTLINRESGEIAIIENKIFSLETANQTLDYALEEFSNKVAEDLDVENPKFSYFYLSLDGYKPKSTVFKSITYGEERLQRYVGLLNP